MIRRNFTLSQLSVPANFELNARRLFGQNSAFLIAPTVDEVGHGAGGRPVATRQPGTSSLPKSVDNAQFSIVLEWE